MDFNKNLIRQLYTIDNFLIIIYPFIKNALVCFKLKLLCDQIKHFFPHKENLEYSILPIIILMNLLNSK